MTMDQLLSYHSKRTDSVCPGHPEIENDGIEVTTGPLGQGLANSVGLAMATKNLAAHYNKPGFPLVDNMTWCMIGDACLQVSPRIHIFSEYLSCAFTGRRRARSHLDSRSFQTRQPVYCLRQ